MHMMTALQRGVWALLLWPYLLTVSIPLDCKEEQGSFSRCPYISQEKLLDRVIQHAELIYRVSEESCSLFDKWLLHSVLILVQSWIGPMVYLQTTMDHYDGVPDMLLNKTKWVSEKLISLEQGVVVLLKKMLDEGMITTTYSEQGLFQYEVQPDMLESVMRDYTLLSCFKKDAHKMEVLLKLLKCRQTNNCP
ncbi:somatolactin alpha isoform X3 [Larimichthys crocea]|uniref:somatolactin alpha isoform X3 n=1 Tax=Larimichthys crocea TaxID=215358 RepID=UPI000F5EF8F8|nr:somatolactin isoform X3 [Larimichthys crocea]